MFGLEEGEVESHTKTLVSLKGHVEEVHCTAKFANLCIDFLNSSFTVLLRLVETEAKMNVLVGNLQLRSVCTKRALIVCSGTKGRENMFRTKESRLDNTRLFVHTHRITSSCLASRN